MALARWIQSSSFVLAAALAAGCSSSGSGATATAVTAPGGSATTASAVTTAATGATGTTVAAHVGPVDCAAVRSVLGGLTVTWQVIAQLPNQTDLKVWATQVKALGSFDAFPGQLDAVQAQFGSDSDVVTALDFMRGAVTFVKQGLAGDTTAPQQLKSYLGGDITRVTGIAAPVARAMSAANC